MDLRIFLHITFESGCALFCIIAAFYLRLYRSYSPKVAKTLTGGLLTNAVINLADMLAYFYRGNTTHTGYVMVRISNFVVFAGMFVLLAFGNALLDNVLEKSGGGKERKLRNAGFAICGAGIALLILSRLFGFMYSFDAQNCYYRGKAYVLLPLTAVAAIILMLIRTVRERGSLRGSEFRVFVCFWLFPIAGAVMQFFFYGISLSNIANTISLIIMLWVFMGNAINAISIRETFALNGESIEGISEALDSFLEGTGTEKQNRIRIRFTIEDALLRLRKKAGEAGKVKLTAGIKFGKPSIKLEHQGDAFNPFIKTGSEYDDWGGQMLSSAGLSPTYSYSHGTNVMKIALGRMTINPVLIILMSILFGLIIGNVAGVALRAGDSTFVTQGLLMPVYDLWNNILFSVSAPAMIIIVMSTMLDTREVSEQGGSTGLITGRYFAVSILVGVITFAGAVIYRNNIFTSDNVTKETIADLIRKLFSVVPKNVIDPFRDFNTAQLILMGIILAYAVMALGHQAAGVSSLIHELNLISTQLAQWIAGLMPLFTIFLTAQMVLEHNGGLLLGMFRVLPFAIIVSILVMIPTLIYVSARMHVRPWTLAKKLWPSFLLTLKTGQVADSYALAEKCCHRDLGMQKLFTQRVLPLGLVLYMPVSVIGMLSFVTYAAVKCGIVITPIWMISTIVFALILLIAAPPIPGVDLLSYVVILEQLGIDNKYIIAALIFDIIFNMFASAANQMMLQLDMLLQADHVGMLDHDKLTAETAE